MRFNILFLLSVMLFITPMTVSAGDIDSPGPPSSGSGMYTFEDIYNYLIDGTEPVISSTFKEPAAGPGPTMKSTLDIYDDVKATFDSCDAAPDQVMDTVTFFSTDSGNWGPKSGSLATRSVSDATVNQPAGYYDAFDLSAIDTDLTSVNIKAGAIIFGVPGDSNVVNTSSGDAVAGDMLSGKKAWVGGSEVTGSMPDKGAVTYTPGTADQAVAAGYHNGSGKVDGDANLIGSNIKSGATIFGVPGSVIKSTGDAAVGDVLTGKIFSRSGAAGLTGTMTNNGAGGTISPGTADQTVAAGYWSSDNTVSGDPDLVTGNIRSGVNIFGVSGKVEVVDTTEGANPVTAERMKTGDVAFVNGTKVTGTGTKTLSAASDTVNEGYYEATTLSAVDADLVTGNIKSGVTIFGVQGERHGGCDCSGGTLNGTRWCDNGDGTVTDLTTCLVWLQKADWGESKLWQDCTTYDDAHTRAGRLNKDSTGANLSDGSVEGDWRLPTETELIDLANDPEQVRSGSMRAFTGVQSGEYWSSTTGGVAGLGGPSTAWGVRLGDGNVYFGSKGGSHYVWPVRSGN